MEDAKEKQQEDNGDQNQENTRDEASIISDQDESTGTSKVRDDSFAGPASNSIEASDLSDEFLAGEVDVREQMDRAVEAIQDALEGEVERGPREEDDESDVDENNL